MKLSRRGLLGSTALGLLSFITSTASAFWQSRDSNYDVAIGGAPPPPAITYVGSATANATTVTVPAHLPGDLIIIIAGRATTAAPTLPAGYLSPATATKAGTTSSGRIGYKWATATNDASGTWTNAAQLDVHVLRPPTGYTLGIGAIAWSSSTTNTVNYPALTLADGSGNSWIIGFGFVTNATETINSPPSGMTNRSTLVGTDSIAGHDTNGGVASWSSTNVTTTGTAGNSVSCSLEIMLLSKTVDASVTNNLYQYEASHMLSPGQGISNATFKIPLPNSSGAGNCYTLIVNYPNGSAFSGTAVDDTNGNTWGVSPDIHINAGAGNNDTAVFILPNIASGVNTVTVHFTTAINDFSYCFFEHWGIDTSSPLNGSNSHAFIVGPSLASGSGTFTPTSNPGNGNVILFYSCVSEAGGAVAKNPSAMYPPSGFTLLESDIGTPVEPGGRPHTSSCFLQMASAAINPTGMAVGDTDHFNTLAIALKVSPGSGTAPAAGIRIFHKNHFTTSWSSTTSVTFQVPAFGNLRLMCDDDPNFNFATVNLTDSEGNTLTADGVLAGFWRFENSTANPNLFITVNSYGAATQSSFRFCDINGATASPFDGAVLVSNNPTGTTFTTNASITPTTSKGLIVANVELGQGPGLSVTTANWIWDLCTYPTGETDLDTMENADIMAHFYYSSSPGAVAPTFTCKLSTSCAGGMIAFKGT